MIPNAKLPIFKDGNASLLRFMFVFFLAVADSHFLINLNEKLFMRSRFVANNCSRSLFSSNAFLAWAWLN